jgi:hypothetical protein
MWLWDEKPFTEKELKEYCDKCGLKVLKTLKSAVLHEIGVLCKKK